MSDAARPVLALLGTGLVDPDRPVVRADDAGLTRGDGCFEGLRVCRAGDGSVSIDNLESHLARMGRSAVALGLPFDAQAWADLAAEACAEWARQGADEAALKLVLTRGPAGLDRPVGFASIYAIAAETIRQRAQGIRVVTLDRGYPAHAFGDAPWLLGGVKLLSYAINMAAEREAARRGVDDVIFVAADAIVLEAPTSSVMWWARDTLFTTPTGPTGILAGTTQARLFDRAAEAGMATGVDEITSAALHAADAVWLASSVRGVVEVIELDGSPRPRRADLHAAVRRHAGF